MNNQLSKYYSRLLTAVVALALYFLVFLPIEFLITEVYFVIPRIGPLVSSLILLILLLLVNLFNWEKLISLEKRKPFLIFILFSLIVYFVYRGEKLRREYLPKIYRVKPSWVIQAQRVEIRGVNFGPTFNKGKVLFAGEPLIVKHWDENRVIAEAPVPSKIGNDYLLIETAEGNTSNRFPFEVKDPIELLAF